VHAALPPVVDRIRAALAGQRPLRLRGHGSKDFYGASLQGEVLDTTALCGVRSYEPSELVVTVGAGTPLAELEDLLAEHGQCLPFEPPHFAWDVAARAAAGAKVANAAGDAEAAGTVNTGGSGGIGGKGGTVGGMVAAGLAGPARASVGGVRDYVLGLQMVDGRAQVLTFGGQMIKNVAGYDVSRLMVGAMGTLGLITEVSLKVLPVAPGEATLVFALDQHAALEQLHRWGGQSLPLNASCWVHDDTDPAPGARDLLFVRLRGAVAAVEAACRSMLAEVAGTRMDLAQAQADWALCRDQQLPFFIQPRAAGLALWRVSVPQTAPVLDLPGPQLVEWHGALRWLWAPLDAAPQVHEAARTAGGFATLFIAYYASNTGATGAFGLKNEANGANAVNLANAAHAAIEQRVKHSFDPQGIFNPGRMPLQG
jgi:glycolate oxidase FAD binding subunit